MEFRHGRPFNHVPVSPRGYGRGVILRMCPDCLADLLETTTGSQMTSQERRYHCPDCGANWRALDGETLVEDE
jgi:predicted RNA-binding Zn-ribbon protein involved in translation (DUF1610 family)